MESLYACSRMYPTTTTLIILVIWNYIIVSINMGTPARTQTTLILTQARHFNVLIHPTLISTQSLQATAPQGRDHPNSADVVYPLDTSLRQAQANPQVASYLG